MSQSSPANSCGILIFLRFFFWLIILLSCLILKSHQKFQSWTWLTKLHVYKSTSPSIVTTLDSSRSHSDQPKLMQSYAWVRNLIRHIHTYRLGWEAPDFLYLVIGSPVTKLQQEKVTLHTNWKTQTLSQRHIAFILSLACI